MLEKEYVLPVDNEKFRNSPVFRKDKPIGKVFGSGLSWAEALDACADVYNGVSSEQSLQFVRVGHSNHGLVCFLVVANFAWRLYLV